MKNIKSGKEKRVMSSNDVILEMAHCDDFFTHDCVDCAAIIAISALKSLSAFSLVSRNCFSCLCSKPPSMIV